MTIPSEVLLQANRVAPQVEPTGDNPKTPIQVGVDSHKIEFHLGSAHAKKVGTVVGASFDRQIQNDSLKGVAPRLKELANSGALLVSFASSSSFERLAQENPQKPLHLNSTSLIEKIQASLKPGNPHGLRLSNEITIKGMTITPSSKDASEIPYLEGEIEVEIQSSNSVKESKKLKFIEFSPEYDGRSLDENTLLNALLHLPNKTANATSDVHPHFYSMNGIGRSASLAVLYSFKKMSEQECGFSVGEVEGHLNTLIKQGREQRGVHFVNTPAQEAQLLNACISLNNTILNKRKPATDVQHRQDFEGPTKRLTTQQSIARKPATPAVALASTTPPPKPVVISEAISRLATDVPTGIRDRHELPYMPIKLEGIEKIVNDSEKFPFPQVNKEQAKLIAADIVWAGFYGDALGADLESKFYLDRRNILVGNMSNWNKLAFQMKPLDFDPLLIQQLKRNNGRRARPHQATDDTQQGLLSAMATMEWMSTKVHTDHNALANKILKSFREPTFPVPNQYGRTDQRRFKVRGSADTLAMCQAQQRFGRAWNDVAIEGIGHDGRDTGARAGGAGNGGMMRIGYDLVPLLASGASMQDLVEQALISNQVTHPSSFSAVASVGQVVLMAKCIDLRIKAERSRVPVTVPPNFFIDTFHQVAEVLEHPDQNFGLNQTLSRVPAQHKERFADEWRSERLPSEFLKSSSTSTAVVKAGSVEQALIESQNMGNSSKEIDSVLKRWSSNSYLGATFPSVVFLLEKFGRGQPAHAVNMAALVTKDSDTCATIIAQVMGALYGSKWVGEELKGCKNWRGQSTFSEDLGGGFEIKHFLSHINNFYDQQASNRTH